MKQYFSFSEMLTPRFIGPMHLVAQACIFIIFIGSSITALRLQSISGFFSALIVCAISSVAARAFFDFMAVVFRIYDVLRDIRRNGIRVLPPASQGGQTPAKKAE